MTFDESSLIIETPRCRLIAEQKWAAAPVAGVTPDFDNISYFYSAADPGVVECHVPGTDDPNSYVLEFSVRVSTGEEVPAS
jgi:hypothetical protein